MEGTNWSFLALIPSAIQSTMLPSPLPLSLLSHSLNIISARVGSFWWLTSKIFKCSPLSSIAKCSSDFHVSTGRLHFLQDLINSSNAGLVESKPIWLHLSLLRRVGTKHWPCRKLTSVHGINSHQFQLFFSSLNPSCSCQGSPANVLLSWILLLQIPCSSLTTTSPLSPHQYAQPPSWSLTTISKSNYRHGWPDGTCR